MYPPQHSEMPLGVSTSSAGQEQPLHPCQEFMYINLISAGYSHCTCMQTTTSDLLEQLNCEAMPMTGRMCAHAICWRYLAKILLGY